jgi:hypothetical protein
MTRACVCARVRRRAEGRNFAAVRHFGGAVGETGSMHRVSDRAQRRARAYEGRAA